MQNNLFDNFVKQAVENTTTEVPKGLWEKIAQENKKRKPIAFWYNNNLGFAIVFVAIVLALIFATNNSKLIPIVVKDNNLTATDVLAFKEKNSTINFNKLPKSVESNNVFVGLNQSKKIDIKQSPTIFSENISLESNNTNVLNSESEVTKLETELNNTNASAVLKNVETSTIPIQLPKISLVNSKSHLENTSINKNLIFGLGCPGESKYPWMVEAYASPDFSFRKISAKGVNDFFLRRKDSTENLKMGFSIGVRLSRKINDYVVLKTGVQYAQINERVTLISENERRTTTQITIRSVVRSPGDTIFVRDTNTVTQIGYLTRKIKNRYKHLEIPILASFETKGDRFKLAATVGGIVNITSWYSGFVLDTSNTLVPISHNNNADGFYKSQVGLSLFASVSAIKRIGEKAEIFAEPYMRVALNNNSISNVGYTQRFSGIGMNMGVRITLPTKSSKTQ
jgi:hypothetical protein